MEVEVRENGQYGAALGTAGGQVRVVLYIRVSTDEQVEHGFSIPEQKRELLSHAEREGWYVVDTVVDDGYSGSVVTRPGLDRVTRMAESGEIDVVLAKKRNRLFRSRYWRLAYERDLKELGVRLVALDDTGNRFADAVSDEFADWYREEVAKNTTAGRMQKAREGKLIATHTPIFGFEYTPDREGYVVVPERMAIVEQVIRLVARGRSLHSIKKELEREGIPAPRGGRVWNESTLRNMVLEDAYRGVVWYPKRKVTQLDPDPQNGYRRPHRTALYSREEQVAIPVVDSGIPHEVIDAAREAIRENHLNRGTGHRVYELAGIVRCAECMNLLSTNRKMSGTKHYFYYRCARNQRHGLVGCEMRRHFRAEVLERAVLMAVLDVVKDKDELIRKAEEDFEEKRRELMDPVHNISVARLMQRETELEKQRLEYVRQRAREAISDEELDVLLRDVDAEIDRMGRALVNQEQKEEKLKELKKIRDKTIEMIEEGKWQQLGITAPEKRKERYRDIGLQAKINEEKKIELSWAMGTKTIKLALADKPTRRPASLVR